MPADQPRIIEGDLSVRDLRIACVAARFNDIVVDALVRGALDTLKRHGVARSRSRSSASPALSRFRWCCASWPCRAATMR
jgi:hypothetical protein